MKNPKAAVANTEPSVPQPQSKTQYKGLVAQGAIEPSVPVSLIPEGWMRDREKVEELRKHLEGIGWQPDANGDPDCVDQGAAMAEEVIRKILLPLITEARGGSHE